MEFAKRTELRIRRHGEQNAKTCEYQNDAAENLLWMDSALGTFCWYDEKTKDSRFDLRWFQPFMRFDFFPEI